MVKRKKEPEKRQAETDKATLGDFLNQDILTKLQEKKHNLKAKQLQQEEEEAEKRREERRQREKNKSFEELFNESHMDWKKFK